MSQDWLSGIVDAVQQYKTLPHRLQKVASYNNIAWYDDSKATNVSSAVAGVNAISRISSGEVIWICGGISKGVDLSPLASALENVRSVICYGQDAALLAAVTSAVRPTFIVPDLTSAVAAAKEQALENDTVILAPACSSFDQFRDFNERGDVFEKLIKAEADAG